MIPREFTTVVVQDGLECPASVLHDAGERIARHLTRLHSGRAAVLSPRLDVVIPALLASERAHCELLLLRGQPTGSADLWSRWAVDTVLSDQLELVPTGVPTAPAPGFSVLLTTSGTSGAPKVARHAIERLVGRIRSPRPDQAAPTWLLTYHPATFAGLQVVLTALTCGGRLVATSDLGVASLAKAAVACAATHVSGTPTFWRAFLIALGADAALLPLRQITLGGEAVDQVTLDRLEAAYPLSAITHIYASTEAGVLFAVHDRRSGFPSRWLCDTVDGVALRIRSGILEVRSPRAMEGYVSGTGRSVFTDDGWLVTQDLVEERGDRVFFVGRADSIINVGGAKVSPDEVEAVLLGVEGVAEARVFGAANRITGQLITADVVLHSGFEPESIRRAIAIRARAELAPFKVPRVIRFVDAIPFLATGKKNRQT